MSGPSIYLDYAAATPLAERVLKAMQPYLSDNFYNPSATYRTAHDVRKALEEARALVGHWLGARQSEIIFTAGGTEANNLAVHGIMRRFPGANIIISAIEHESVLAPARHYNCREAKVDAAGRLLVDDLRRNIDDDTVLVSIMYANNEIGTFQPLRTVSQALQEVRDDRRARGVKQPLYMHTDSCQAANYFDLHVARLGVDLMTINGGKIYGPKQSGALYVKAGVRLEPLIDGGGQERGLRSGTENAAGVIGLAAALDLVQTERRQESERLALLQREFFALLQEEVPLAVVNGSMKYRLPNNVHITIPGYDNERLLFQLDEVGIMAAAGSACNADSGEPSHVLRSLGLSDEAARSSLRFTMGRSTTDDMVKRTIRELARLTKA